MGCCGSCGQDIDGTDQFFTKQAASYIKRFKKKGLERSQKQLMQGLHKNDLKGLSILEIGCGVGYFHNQLIQDGCSRAIGVDISKGMVRMAKMYSKKLGNADNTRYLMGDYMQHHQEIEQQDITILDKVFCCYENCDDLLAESSAKTKKLYAFTLPRDDWWFSPVFKFFISTMKLFRFTFHPYAHPVEAIGHFLREKGFKEIHKDSTFIWKSFVFSR